MPDSPSNKVPLRSACEACRNRKLKCTGERPTCARCAKRSQKCEYLSASNTRNYISTLVNRIEALEAEKAASSSVPAHSPIRLTLSSLPTPRVDTPPSPPSVSHAEVPLQDLNRTSPAFSTFTSHTTRVTESSQPTLDAERVMRLPLDFDFSGEVIYGDVVSKLTDPPLLPVDRSFLPPSHVTDRLLDHFLTYTNASYPIFHVPTLLAQINDIRRADRSLPRSDVCIASLVLAVSATSLPKYSPLHTTFKPRAIDYWEHAQRFWPTTNEAPGTTHLQLLLLQLQYVLYNPNAGSVWDLSGSAVRAAVDLGLNLEPNNPAFSELLSPLDVDLRRRLFWIAYSMDRIVCSALGRPPAITDDWITAGLPSEMDDSAITTVQIVPGEPSKVKLAAIHRIRLRRLQSEIHHRLYVPSSASQNPPSAQWYESMVQRLSQWRVALPPDVQMSNDSWADLKYHLTLVLLYRPSPGNASPGREGLANALTSSGTVMRTYKSLYRAGRINFNWVSIYQLFIAGVTYLNSVWQAHRNGWTIVPSYSDAFCDVQTCTSVMEGLAAVTPGTSGIRDAFEAVSEKIIRHLASRAQFTSYPSSPHPIESSAQILPMSPELAITGDSASHLPSHPITHSDPFHYDPFAPTNPFDGFLLQPLEEMAADDYWQRAIAQALQPFEADAGTLS